MIICEEPSLSHRKPFDKASTSFHAETSTPNVSGWRLCACATSMPNVSVIERSTSAPILVSDASIADLQRHFKRCSPSKSSTSSSCSRKASPRSCYRKESPRHLLRRASLTRCVQLHRQKLADKAGCFEELYFNDDVKKSGGSSPRGPCTIDDCAGIPKPKVKKVCSAGVMTTIEKDVRHRSCGKMVKDSGATCSLVESGSATCEASERAAHYHNKLHATLQILRNKEDTIEVQAESLAVAEARIAKLTERANDLRRELDRKTKEYHALRKHSACCKPEKTDVCIVTDTPMEDQRDIVHTLENNLSVIEELYRECFYETAKQESLIDMLRSSYLDVRLTDRQKADQIGRLQSVINTQKWSLDRCQDIAMEVDGLKMEITNFLSSSTPTNNDSGMWERSEDWSSTAPGVQEDLHDVTEQLLRLQNLLTAGIPCTCDLQEENINLKKEVECLEINIGELRGKICDLECNLANKNNQNLKYSAEIECKDEELNCLKCQLLALEESTKDHSATCEALSMQLQTTKGLLDEKTSEMAQMQQQIESQTCKIKDLREELEKADQMIKENCKMRSEVSYLTTQVSLWRAQLEDSQRRARALDAELARTRAHAAHIDDCYREKASNVAELQAHLEAAHERGTALCGEARHAVCAVRTWMRRMRDRHREQENLIKEKDALLTALQRRLEERQSDSQRTSASENTPSCSKCLSSRDERKFCIKLRERRDPCAGPSTSSTREMPSCSSTPVPLRKKHCSSKRCKAWMCDVSIQEPLRSDAGSDASAATTFCARHDVRHVRHERPPRDVSPTEELLLRVEQLSEALADGNRRWTRPHDAR